MADYTILDPNSFLQGQPITQAQGQALEENLRAVAEGAFNAPRLYLRALERLTAGDEIRSRRDALQSVDTSEAVIHSFAFMQYGTIRARGELVSGGNSRIIIYRTRSGTRTAVTTGPTGTAGFVISDVAVLPGDLVEICVNSPSGAGSGRNGRFSTAGEDLWPGSALRLEGNRDAT
jgi:hypothetical protein